jgi:GTP-binding protein HflX
VLDRDGLILDIFAQRAASFEGQLQVELAQLEHLSTRLVRGWSHLERQKGGIGLRGPGETQLETDRRLIGQRIKRLKARLDRVQRQRETGRRERLRAKLPVVALVGYTNAGKTTLFNRLSGAALEAKDQLFATLDPTIRRLTLNPGEQVLLADTVGFVRDLPHELVAAFRATLTETRDAALLLHVIDASDPHHEDRTRQVEGVLAQIGASEVPMLRVYNKCDNLADSAELAAPDSAKISVSARTGAGLDRLLEAIRAQAVGMPVAGQLRLEPAQSRIRAQLFDWDAVRSEEVDSLGRFTLEVELSARRWRELSEKEGLSRDSILRKA